MESGFDRLRPQNDGGEGRFQDPFLFPCRKKKRFLESKEKGAFENWGAVGCPAAACVFPPPSGTSPGRYGLCGRNREKRVCCLPAAWAMRVAAWFGAQIRGPARTQRSGMGDPAEGGTPFAGRAGAAERTKPAACGRMRDAQLATATGEDEQGSGARNARQPRGPHKADQPCGERTNSGANETCPQGRGERCETCEDVTVRTLRGRRRAPHKEALRPIHVILRP